jgi:hypothetical protein
MSFFIIVTLEKIIEIHIKIEGNKMTAYYIP